MRILLIKPRWPVGYGHIRSSRFARYSPLGLGIIAAHSDGHEVEIVDADFQSIPYHRHFDLVGISVTTFVALEAFRIADRFRARGVPVVLGGVHPTLKTEECLPHADAIVRGEAEYIWPKVLEDAKGRALSGVYQADHPTEMEDVRPARRDLMHELDWFTSIEATRGCPNRCKYCYLPSTPWARHRKRPVEKVVREIASLRQQVFIFVDENLYADRDYAVELLRAIAPLKKGWLSQAPTTIVNDDVLLDVMADSGCFDVHIGFQSFNRGSLEAAQVDHNRVSRYRQLVRKLRERGVGTTGFFMFGLDHDGPDVFDSTVEMIKDMGVDDAGMFIVTPFPGTQFSDQLEREGRLLEGSDLSSFTFNNALFHPKQMTIGQLEKGVRKAYDDLQPYFLRRLIWRAWTQRRLLLKAPQLVPAVLFGNHRQSRPHS